MGDRDITRRHTSSRVIPHILTPETSEYAIVVSGDRGVTLAFCWRCRGECGDEVAVGQG